MYKTLLVLLASILLLAAFSAEELSRFERSSLEKQEEAQKILFLTHEPMQFGLRRGHVSEDMPDRYLKQHEPENLQRMARLGSRYGRLHFYKGFGLDFEMPEMRRAAQAAQIMHELDMKVSLYVGGTMFIETFFRETPEAVNWEQRDQYNRPVPYSVGTQTFRHFACPNEPAYHDYMKRVLDIGIDMVKADQFFFDNYFLRAEPKSCRCPRCMKGFAKYLQEKYPTKEAATARYGYPSADYVRVNEWSVFNRPEDMTSVDDPILQEWLQFRCESLVNQCQEYYQYIKKRNPSISVGFNLKGIYSMNRIWTKAVHHPLFEGICDFFCFDIGGVDPGINPETGALVTEIRSYKTARTMNTTCSVGDPGIELAEQMAFNNQTYLEGFGYHGAGYNHYAQRLFSPLAEFFREYNDRFYTETDNVADCAVFRSFPSLAYSISAAWIPTTLMEQVLIQHKIPFDLIYDQQIDRIAGYQAVILAGQESLASQDIEKFTSFVRGGGTLIFTGNTADYNQYRRQRSSNPLIDLMGLRDRPAATTFHQLGAGTLIYIPEIKPGMEIVPAGPWDFPPTQWVLPKNHGEIARTLKNHLPKGPSLLTGAPITTAAELLKRDSTKETIVHFVNYNQEKRIGPFPVELKPQFSGPVRTVRFYSSELSDPLSLEHTLNGDRIRFQMPRMGMYAMVVVSQSE